MTQARILPVTASNAIPKRRVKKARGAHALAFAKLRTSRLRETRLTNQIERVGFCAVCGMVPEKDEKGNWKEPWRFRDYLCFRVLLCDRHEHVGLTVTLNGKLRFHELPKETTDGHLP